MTKDQQTAHWLGWVPAGEITRMLAAGYTSAQIALATGSTLAHVTAVLAKPTPV